MDAVEYLTQDFNFNAYIFAPIMVRNIAKRAGLLCSTFLIDGEHELRLHFLDNGSVWLVGYIWPEAFNQINALLANNNGELNINIINIVEGALQSLVHLLPTVSLNTTNLENNFVYTGDIVPFVQMNQIHNGEHNPPSLFTMYSRHSKNVFLISNSTYSNMF